MNPSIRPETAADITAIAELTRLAFLDAPHTSHTEQFIVDALRREGQLSLSLVAQHEGHLVGHVAVSPVTLSDGTTGWYGLGPVCVLPGMQGQGVGKQLVRAALAALATLDAQGCVVLGDPRYYGKFGFRTDPQLVLEGVPPEYFQALWLSGAKPHAQVHYGAAFSATA